MHDRNINIINRHCRRRRRHYSTLDQNREDTASKNLLKWKGVMFETDGDDKTVATMSSVQTPETTTTTSSEPDASWATMIEVKSIAADGAATASVNAHSQHQATSDENAHKVTIIWPHFRPIAVALGDFEGFVRNFLRATTPPGN